MAFSHKHTSPTRSGFSTLADAGSRALQTRTSVPWLGCFTLAAAGGGAR